MDIIAVMKEGRLGQYTQADLLAAMLHYNPCNYQIETFGFDLLFAFVVSARDAGELVSISDFRACVELLDYVRPETHIHEGWGGVEADSNAELIAECFLFNMRDSNDGFEYLPKLLGARLISYATYRAYKNLQAEAA